MSDSTEVTGLDDGVSCESFSSLSRHPWKKGRGVIISSVPNTNLYFFCISNPLVAFFFFFFLPFSYTK
jgi:hypothetical protein